MKDVRFDDISKYNREQTLNPSDFTKIGQSRLARLIEEGLSEDDDSDMIYDCLKNNMQMVSFGDYLRRYIFERLGRKGDYNEISIHEYRKILMESFRETYTPRSFHKTTTRFSTLAEGWLTKPSVSRETVFLLGFGLNMSLDDVSRFLTDALKEQDFNTYDPREVIFWYCLQNHKGAGDAIHYLEEYDRTDYAEDHREADPDSSLVIREKVFRMKNEEDLKAGLRYLLSENRSYPFSRTCLQAFKELYEEARMHAWASENDTFDNKQQKKLADFSHAEFEKMLYAGIASDKSGNLRKASASDLQKYLSQKRLSRQRISQILSGKTRVSRYDLMTLVFYNISMECDPDTRREERFNAFVSSVNTVMDRCHMGRLNIANPYESFLLMCMLTNGPLIAFGDVWDFSYENDQDNH